MQTLDVDSVFQFCKPLDWSDWLSSGLCSLFLSLSGEFYDDDVDPVGDDEDDDAPSLSFLLLPTCT